MCGWTGKGSLAARPVRVTSLRTLLAVIGPPRSDTNRYGPSGQSRRSCSKLSPDMKKAIGDGIADGWTDFSGVKKRLEAGEVTWGDAFGTREYLKNNYLYRMLGAVIGIYGNSKLEAMYPLYFVDSEGQKLDGADHRYSLRFAPGQLPPVNAFWSVTMYELPSLLLVTNPLNRYLINSPMLPDLKRDADGGLTLYIQSESPSKEQEANWLPAPKGSFAVAMRLYWPKKEAVEGTWKQPPMQKVQ